MEDGRWCNARPILRDVNKTLHIASQNEEARRATTTDDY